ncbi:hypothetical protein GHT06_022333 [Daphnia sinensis]|uniref:Uncharacterized protein n=1 Tax=Daphnia sinensis TaxID=1820382 RepID=A0AAD5KXP2_9CRUS|nr:hypothetical protein GHT06_022333 [Daphnia sinensis]
MGGQENESVNCNGDRYRTACVGNNGSVYSPAGASGKLYDVVILDGISYRLVISSDVETPREDDGRRWRQKNSASKK